MKFSAFLPVVAFVAMSSVAMAQEKVGVAECDTFLEQYTACAGKMPEAARPSMTSAIDQMRASFRAAAADATQRAALPQACTQARQMMAQNPQITALGCQFQ